MGGMVSYRAPGVDFSPTKMTDSILERGNQSEVGSAAVPPSDRERTGL